MQADSPAVRLAIAGLDVRFGDRRVVDIDELHVGEAEIVGLAGESGSGKSMTTLAVLGLAHTVGATVRGSIRLDGTELTGLSQQQLREVRGRRIAAIFQSPATAQVPQRPLGQAHQLGAVQRDAAAHRGADCVRQAKHRQRGHRLAGSAFPGQPDDLGLAQRQLIDADDLPGAEAHVKTRDRQPRRGRCIRLHATAPYLVIRPAPLTRRGLVAARAAPPRHRYRWPGLHRPLLLPAR